MIVELTCGSTVSKPDRHVLGAKAEISLRQVGLPDTSGCFYRADLLRGVFSHPTGFAPVLAAN